MGSRSSVRRDNVKHRLIAVVESRDLRERVETRNCLEKCKCGYKRFISGGRSDMNQSAVLAYVKRRRGRKLAFDKLAKIFVTEGDVIKANRKIINSSESELREMYNRNRISLHGKDYSLLLPDDKIIKKLVRQDFV